MTQLSPHSSEAERLVLGQALTDNSVIDQIAHYIPEDKVFYETKHQKIWKSILDMHRDGAKVIDVVTITAKIPPSQDIQSPAYYLTGLISDIPTTANAEQYAKIIYEKWLLRKVIHQSEKIKGVMAVDGSEAYQLLQRLHREIEDILNLRVREDFTLSGLVDETIENMMTTDNLVPFGLPKLDELTGGMTKGEITVIAGRPGHFKSTMMINIVKNLIGEGAKLGVSSRGMGSLEEKGGANYVKDDFYLATAADIVADPSAPDAFVEGMMEGKEWIWDNGVIKENIISKISKNIKDAPAKNLEEVKLRAFNSFLSNL